MADHELLHEENADAPEVVEGTVIATGRDARLPVLPPVAAVSRTAVRLVRHERTVATGRAVVRNVVYVPAGAAIVARRLWDASSASRYERVMRLAEANGDLVTLADWEARAQRFRDQRHRRRIAWLHAPKLIAQGFAITVLSVAGFLLALGIVTALARHDASQVVAPINAVLTVIAVIAAVVAIVWGPLVLAIPWVIVLWLWDVGRRRAEMPAWLATSASSDVDVTIDESTITQALAALRIVGITAALKLGPLQFLTPAHRDGRGVAATIRLPKGVTAEEVSTAAKRAKLATGLYRAAREVWPAIGSEAGILDLWIADKGALEEGAGPYPLLESGRADFFKGVPFGRTLRGDPVMAPLNGRNTICGGMPGQGKSSSARTIVAGASLDPTVEVWVLVPDTNYDFESFRPRCSRYVMGIDDAAVEAIMDALRALNAEIQRRGDLLVRHQITAVNREAASAGIGLHPIVCLLEEAHVLIQHRTHGKEASQLLSDIVKLCRKRGIHVIVSTQAPTADSMPRDVTRNCSNGIAHAVGDHVANDGLLGQGAYRAGHRATELIPGTDAGTALVKGFNGQRSQIVQVYYIDADKDHDQVTPIVRRSIDALKGRPVPGAGQQQRPVVEARDLLEDLAAVLGDEPVPAADVPALLSRAFPAWEPYRRLTGKALREQLLAEHGIKVPATGNRWPVDPITVRHALAWRSGPDDDSEEPFSELGPVEPS